MVSGISHLQWFRNGLYMYDEFTWQMQTYRSARGFSTLDESILSIILSVGDSSKGLNLAMVSLRSCEHITRLKDAHYYS